MSTAIATTFEPGSVYYVHSNADWDCVFEFTVMSRTAKFVTFKTRYGDIARVGVKVDEDGEWALPFGNYSMDPCVRAGHEFKEEVI
jgi:hypothetical protein